MSLTATLYKKLVPRKIRNSIIRKKILDLYASSPELQQDLEWKEVAGYLEKNPLAIFPYTFTEKYRKEDVQVFRDDNSGMHYVIQDGKKLYFKRGWTAEKIQRAYNSLRTEQDKESPHYYTTASFDVEPGDVLADIGSAEGNFSLTVVDKVKKLYLFECDPGWIEALEKTFEPWKDKVEIIPKFVSDINDATHCRGDDFFADKQLDFLKIDVDGGERPLLAGFAEILKNRRPLKLAICTYHQQEDEKEFTALLEQDGFTVSPSHGYMIFHYDKMIRPPYLRRGLIRGIR